MNKFFGMKHVLVSAFWLAAFSLAAVENGLILHLPLEKDYQDRSQFKHEITGHGEITFADDSAWFSGCFRH